MRWADRHDVLMTEDDQPTTGDRSRAGDRSGTGDRSRSDGDRTGTARATRPGSSEGAATGGRTDGGRTPPRFTRSRQHKVVSGVCGGLGRTFDIDPVIFRVSLAVISVAGGLGLIAYGFAWLLLPRDDEEENELRRLFSGRVEGGSLSALLCALVGCGLFLASLGSSRNTQLFTLILVGSVVGATYWHHRGRRVAAEGARVDAATAQAVAVAPPEAHAPPAPGSPSWWRETSGRQPGGGRAGGYPGHDTGYLWGPDDGANAESWPGARAAAHGAPVHRPPHPVPTPPPPRRRLSALPPLVFLAALLAGVIGTGATWATEPLGTSLAIGLSGSLAVFGLGLAVSAFTGRLGVGTLLSVVLTGTMLAGAAALPDNITTHWTHATWHPRAVAEVRDQYELGTGRGVLDLTELPLRDGQTVRTRSEVGAGELVVRVPHDVRVRLHLTVSLGGYRLPDPDGPADQGPSHTWIGGGLNLEDRVTLSPVTDQPPRGTIDLRLKMGFGEVRLTQEPPGHTPRQDTAPEPPRESAEPAAAGRPAEHPRPQEVWR